MVRRFVLGAALVAFAAPALAEETTTEATSTAPNVTVEAAAPAQAASSPSTTAEAAPATKARYSGSGSSGCFFSASAPTS